MHIALKETAETEYWLKLLTMSEYITEDMGKSLLTDCLDIKRILIAFITTARENKLHPSFFIIHYSFPIKTTQVSFFRLGLFLLHHKAVVVDIEVAAEFFAYFRDRSAEGEAEFCVQTCACCIA